MKLKPATRLMATVLIVVSGYCSAATIDGSGVLDVDSDESRVFAYDTSVVNLHEGSDVAFTYANDNSHINAYGGTVSWLHLHDAATSSIYKADISFLLLNESARARIFGSGFAYAEGRLHGTWSDGTTFSFWALNMDNDTGESLLPTDVMPAGITLRSVPIPSAILLMFSVMLPISILVRPRP